MSTPDSILLHQNFVQKSVGNTTITPTGGTQAALGDILGGAAVIGGATGILESVADGLTAHAGGGQASALLLTAATNRVTTVATAADSVKLPVSAPGSSINLINDGANALQVFGSGTDTIDAIATGTGVALTAAHRATFYCLTAGAWQSMAGTKFS